jgi:hypothetical protein
MAKKKLSKEEIVKKYSRLSEGIEMKRPAGIPHHEARKKGKWKPLRELDENRLHFLMYQVWRGYTIARNEKFGPEQQKRLKYYAEGIDKIKRVMDERGIKDKHHQKMLSHHALPFPKKPRLFPRYADGLWLKEKGKPQIIIAPLRFFK